MRRTFNATLPVFFVLLFAFVFAVNIAQAGVIYEQQVTFKKLDLVKIDASNKPEKKAEKAKEEYKKAIPLGDYGTALDVANLTLFLLSSYSKYITGEAIKVDGGLYIYQGKGGVSHLETPRGPKSLRDSGIWRFEPSTQNVELMASHPFTQPTRQVIDATGNSILCDKPSGDVHYAGYVSVPQQYPYAESEAIEAQPYKPLIIAGGTTPACLLATNTDFSAAEDGNRSANGGGIEGGYGHPRLILAQHGAFNGLRWYSLSDDMAGFSAEELETPLLRTTDTNFRPMALASYNASSAKLNELRRSVVIQP